MVRGSSPHGNCSIAESIERFEPLMAAAQRAGVRVAEVARLADVGCCAMSLGDPIGVGTPGSVLRMLDAVSARMGVDRLARHFHDTYGMAVANVHAAYTFGLRVLDSSVSGLGGCPYAQGASGNVAPPKTSSIC